MDHCTASEPRPQAPVVPLLLGVQAAGLALVGVALLADAVVGPALACLLGAAVAAGLATSILEGLPDVGSTVLGFEGAAIATALIVVSSPAALGAAVVAGFGLRWARRHEARAQMRRPVPSQ